jgi:UDP:flavonoid glycosyltransferase YjiC (YdhE family)
MPTERPNAAAAQATLHLVFVPFLARSHFGPLAAKAAAAACWDEGTTASILTTPHFAALAPPSVPVHVAPLRSPVAHDDFSLLPDDDASSAQAFFNAAEAALSPALASLLRAHAATGTAVAVVSDAVLYWSPRVARQCGTPHATFHTVGVFSAAAMVAVHLHRPKEFTEPFPVPGGFPRPVTLRAAQVNEAALAHLPVFRAAEAESCAVAFNTFSAMEAEFAEYYRGQLVGRPKNVFLVGPTPATAVINGNAERDPILKWLDARPARSVVYVCFGSTCALGATQLRALASGLRACGHPFLWVIPTTNSTDGIDAEERASSHGMVVAGRWAPQAKVLAHRAVGGFVTHCGWNSVTEAVSAGVPLATWPLRAEQFLNEAFLVEVVRVGVRVREVADREREDVVPAEAVARAVRRLMGGDEGDVARRATANELGVAARAAVAEGGSSCGDWARLMEELKAFYHHAK